MDQNKFSNNFLNDLTTSLEKTPDFFIDYICRGSNGVMLPLNKKEQSKSMMKQIYLILYRGQIFNYFKNL